jgi:hypothetical protein
VNPGDTIAFAGDINRSIDREMDKELIGIAVTVIQCKKPLWTFGFNESGDLISTGVWNDGVLNQVPMDRFIEENWKTLKGFTQ